MTERARSYESVAWCYDALARLYSGGAIARAKSWHVSYLEAGDRVLYVGLGTGEDALLAARHGARVTGVDLSPRMLRAAAHRFAGSGLAPELIRGNFFDHRPEADYDVVVANFVLDIFSPSELERALQHLVSLLRPGGLLALADFAPSSSGALQHCLSAVYYRPVNLAGWLLGLSSLHPIYDYAEHFDAQGIDLVARRRFGLARRGGGFYESLIGAKRTSV